MKSIWLEILTKHPLDNFLGKALGVPGACSPCSQFFSTLDGTQDISSKVDLPNHGDATAVENFSNADEGVMMASSYA